MKHNRFQNNNNNENKSGFEVESDDEGLSTCVRSVYSYSIQILCTERSLSLEINFGRRKTTEETVNDLREYNSYRDNSRKRLRSYRIYYLPTLISS